MLKVKNDPSHGIDTDIFLQQAQTQYNLRYHDDFKTPTIRSLYKGSKSISFLGLKIWNYLPPNLKQLESLNSFKKKIQTGNQKIAPVNFAKLI